jgi:hypothetical protein
MYIGTTFCDITIDNSACTIIVVTMNVMMASYNINGEYTVIACITIAKNPIITCIVNSYLGDIAYIVIAKDTIITLGYGLINAVIVISKDTRTTSVAISYIVEIPCVIIAKDTGAANVTITEDAVRTGIILTVNIIATIIVLTDTTCSSESPCSMAVPVSVKTI